MTTYSVDDSVTVVNFPAVQPVTGSVAVTGVIFSGTITTTLATTGSQGLAIGNAPYAPLYVTGSVALNPTPVITANTATTGSTGLAVGNAPYAPLFVSVTSSLPVHIDGQLAISNFPAIQAVSGNITVTAPAPLPVWSPAPVGVSGTLGAVIENWPAVIGVSASVPLQVFSGGTLGVSGTVSVGNQVSVNNFPATQNVSGTVIAQVTFPANQQVWEAGPVGVTGSVSITNSELAVSNFPAVQAVSGNVAIAYQIGVTGSTFVTTTGSLAVAPGTGVTFPVSIASTVNVAQQGQLSVNNFPAIQAVSGTVTSIIGNWPSTLGVSASFPLSVFNAGTVGVSGSVSISGQVSVNNFPATQNVSGTVTVGSFSTGVTASVQGTPNGIPLQVWSAGMIGVSGTLSTTPGITQTAQNVSSSSGVRVWNDGPVGVSGSLSVTNMPTANDNLNGVVAVSRLPLTSSAYAWSTTVTQAPVSASQIKSTAGIVRSVFGRLDASLAGGAYYVHLYNAVTGVAAGVIGPDLISPQKVFHFNGIDSRFCIDLTAEGAFFSGGLQVAASSTETSFTPIASALSVTALYK